MFKKNKTQDNLLIAIMGDEVTVTGFLLAGIGQRSEESKNFFIINPNQEKIEIEDIFHSLLKRKDIGIILICQNIAQIIRDSIHNYKGVIPTVLEIPSKSYPYIVERDPIIARASKQIFGTSIPPDNIEINETEDFN
jgi:V-type H+-transporting ATPase subunit F